ncbi:MAG: phosphate ABC transporter substrate-binding protein [bacterium]|nr:phosphate ABC transporter substrate-binding protein [bacterium]MDT8395924.1 phosphate ABC transporter substrate-binding protein [bacterium]
MKKTTIIAVMAALICLTFAGIGAAEVKVDSKLPSYKPVKGVSGSINGVGSDTLNNLMTLWAEGFKKFYPNVSVEIEGKGSSTAPPALIAGTSNFGPMSRKMKDKEVDEFVGKFGYKPVALPTSIDMLAVYVNKDNPVEGMSFPQVDAVFSKSRKMGYKKDISNWGQVGGKGKFSNLPVSIYGRNSASGTYGYFKENVLGKGDYKDSVKEQPGSSAVVQGVATDLGGIGYSGIGYKTADVKVVPLAKKEGGKFIPAEPQYAYSGEYPLARFLYVYVNFKPGSDLDPLRKEFVKYIFSKEGQEVVVKDGYLPVSAKIADEALKSVGIK